MPSLKTRFEVFKRDKFTCRYCGRTPPDVVLELDHIIPLSKNGSDDIDNLTTSCFDCNRGKGKKLLLDIPIIDLDIAYLEAQQRLAELTRYQVIKNELREKEDEIIIELQEFFALHLEDPHCQNFPPETYLRYQLYTHDPQEIEKAMIIAINQTRTSYPPNIWKYACAILRNWATNPQEEREYARA